MSNPIPNELYIAISNLFNQGPLFSPFFLRRGADDAAYTAYIFALIVRAVRQMRGTVSFRSWNNPSSAPTVFEFRGAPGYIYQTPSSSGDCGYALCEYNSRQFEIHVSVRHLGQSQVLHEIDVAVIDRKTAQKCRSKGLHPSSGSSWIAVECKFYTSKLGLDLVREFVGLADDMRGLVAKIMASNNESDDISQYCTGKTSRPRFFGDLTPLNPNRENEFIGYIATQLRSTLG